MINTVAFLCQISALISSKIIKFKDHISLSNVVLYGKDMYPLLLEYFLTSLRCMRMIGSASDSVSDPLRVGIESLLPNQISNFKKMYQSCAPV